MKRVTLRERGRVHRLRPGRTPGEDGPDACWLEARVFDRLLAYDRSRGDGSIFDWRVDEALAGQWVGVVQVPGLLLELLPKIDSTGDDLEDGITLARDNLLVMLGEAGDVPLRSRDLADLGTRKAPLHETLITLFARRLRFELLRGADRGYVGELDDLRLMRGKLVIGRHVARNAARRERFTCAFDEFTANTELSRVLKASCRALLERTRSSEAHEALSHCLLMLDDVADDIDARPLLERIVLTRQNERFADLFAFSRLVLQQLSPTAAGGRSTVFSLLFDMDRVFEGFISAMVRRAARTLGDGTRVFPQARTRRRHLMDGAQGGILNLKPDILVEGPGGRLVIDTKWKRLGSLTQRRQAGLAAADLYQLYAYTRRYGVGRSVLLFPRVPGSVERDFAPLAANGEPDGSGIGLRFVHLHRNLRRRAEFRGVVDDLAALVQDNLQPPIASEVLGGAA